MAIDKSGKWWKGDSARDIAEYLIAYSKSSIPVQKTVNSRCDKCGCDEFSLEFDPDEGAARIVCRSCKTVKFLADSQENWDSAKLRKFKCVECRAIHANVGTGFAYRNNGDVKWVFVGVRCSNCGILGSVADWKIDYGPTTELERNI